MNGTQKIDQTAGTTTSNYDIANQLLLTTTFLSAPITHTYDNNGNLLTQISSAGITTYVWDQENRLTSYIGEGAAVPTTYTYSDEGHRQTTTAGSEVTQYVWDEDIVLLEIDNTKGTRTQYTQGPGEWGMLVSQQVNTTVTYLGSDDRNNVRLLLPQAGTGTSANYKAFGSILPTPGTPATPFQYGGNVGYYAESPTENTTDTEFYRTLHRIYRFHSGRFPQPDPTGINGGYNLYGYANNNPISNFDPTGLASNPYHTKPYEVYVELDAFIPDPYVLFPAGYAMGDNRGPSPISESSRYYEAFIINLKTKKVRYLGTSTPGTHVYSIFGEDYRRKSGDDGLTTYQGFATVDRHGEYHLHFDTKSDIPYGLGAAPPIIGKINVTLNKYGDLKPHGITGWHTAFPAFEIWDYRGSKQQALLYSWDPHNVFDRKERSHVDYWPSPGLNTKVGVRGNIRGLMLHSGYW